MIAGSDLLPQEQKLLTFAPLTDKIVFMSIEVPKYIADLSPEERKKFLKEKTPISSSFIEDDEIDPWDQLLSMREEYETTGQAFGKAVAAHQHNSNPIIPTREQSHTVEILYSCHSCSKPIHTTDDYCSIHHFKIKNNRPGRHLHFHEHCFEQIAGKEYM